MNYRNVITETNSWENFKMHLINFSTKEKGDAFELLTKHFLQIDPKFSTLLKEVWLLNDLPIEKKKHLNLPDRDMGIDLVAETKQGEYWAIQCKYRDDETGNLTWKEISTFTGLTFGRCRNFSFGLICSTTEKYTSILKDQDNIGFCTSEVWEGLEKDFFNQLRALLEHKKVLLKPFLPRPHQELAIKNALKHFLKENNERGKLIMPCGTGKSLTAFWIADALEAKTILIAVPSLALISQTLKVWLRESLAKEKDISWLCVCSDESVGEIDNDEIITHIQDLGIPCVTKRELILNWFQKSKAKYNIVFTTYQSGKVIAEASHQANIVYNLGIMDEAHKTVGNKDKLFTYLLKNENIEIKKRLFMTATERRYQGKSDQIISMEDQDLFGETFHLMTFKDALEANPSILSDYKIITMIVSKSEVENLIKKNVFVKVNNQNNEIEAEMLASVIALRKAMKQYPIKHAISFHSSIKRAEIFKQNQQIFTEIHPEYSKIDTFHISGKTPAATRERVIKEFIGSPKSLITNARCLTEGVDVPDIDCVLFADPKRSTIDIVQATGRALRPAKEKEFGYVILPVLIDDSRSAEELKEEGAFDSIIFTLRSLASNDDRIIEFFRAVSQGRKSIIGGSINFDLDERISNLIDIEEFTNAIELKCWDRLAKLSWRPFEEARNYVHNLGINNLKGWMIYAKSSKKPFDIPYSPEKVYRNKGWVNWGDWLGTGRIASRLVEYLPFEEARNFIRKQELKSQKEWFIFIRSKNNIGIPVAPHLVYKNKGWISWGDWLGTGRVADQYKSYLAFKDAREFVHKLKINDQKEWDHYCKNGKIPDNIPKSPRGSYLNKGWVSWGDWLGTFYEHPMKRKYRDFNKAREFIRNLHFLNRSEWAQFTRGLVSGKGFLPKDIPTKPERTYAGKGWIDYSDWLGVEILSTNINYRTFIDAREFARKLKLINQKEWFAFCQNKIPNLKPLPQDISSVPHKTYKNKGWINWGDWLGTGNYRQGEWIPYNEAKKFVHNLKLRNENEWILYINGKFPNKRALPKSIPKYPRGAYKGKGWINQGDWLGTNNIASYFKKYRNYNESKKFVNILGLKNINEWKLFCSGKLQSKGVLPPDIPKTPYLVYLNKGWIDWGEWLGTGKKSNKNKIYLSYEEAKRKVRSLNLKSQSEWNKYYKVNRIENIPSTPERYYKNKGWLDWYDWLGTPRNKYLTYEVAKLFVKELKIRGDKEWRLYVKGLLKEKGRRPENIPSNPSLVYKNKGWIDWYDWLGKERPKRK